MISRDEYNAALDVVEAYHKQLSINIIEQEVKPLSQLNFGDMVKCVEVHGGSINCLTKGKTYEVINLDDYMLGVHNRTVMRFSSRDNNGKLKTHTTLSSQFRAI